VSRVPTCASELDGRLSPTGGIVSRDMSRDLAHFGSFQIASRAVSRHSRGTQVSSRHPLERTENPCGGGSIPSMATMILPMERPDSAPRLCLNRPRRPILCQLEKPAPVA